MAFVEVYRADIGEKVRVPESHLRIFPGVFTTAPRRPAEAKAARSKPARQARSARRAAPERQAERAESNPESAAESAAIPQEDA